MDEHRPPRRSTVLGGGTLNENDGFRGLLLHSVEQNPCGLLVEVPCVRGNGSGQMEDELRLRLRKNVRHPGTIANVDLPPLPDIRNPGRVNTVDTDPVESQLAHQVTPDEAVAADD